MRVEGTVGALIPPTVVPTSAGSYTPFGKAAACPGTSAAEVFNLANLVNGTAWSYELTFAPNFVTSIAGETHRTGARSSSSPTATARARPATSRRTCSA